MGVLDDILEPPPEGMTSRQVTLAILWSALKLFCLGSAVILGVPILFILLINLLY